MQRSAASMTRGNEIVPVIAAPSQKVDAGRAILNRWREKMSKPILLLYIALACFCISVLGQMGTRGKRISSAFKRASELSFVFFYGMIAMSSESVWLGIVGVVVIVCYAAGSEWDDLFRKGFRRLVRYVFRRNAPSNPRK